nr:putative beta-lysine N-acetyltransferase [Aneurinibacillus terranovensis]
MMNVCFDPFNKRMRVDDYRGNICSIENKIRELAGKYAFTKVIVKTRPEHWQTFLSRGYMLEGVFKGYFNGSDAYSMALYFDLERRTSGYWIEEDEILDRVLSLPQKFERPDLPSGYALRLATADDADQLAVLYNDVFQTYPTPMNKPHYIKNVMEEGTLFFLIENSGRIVSAASAEVNASYHNAEMTDCATLPEHRKHGLMRVLIIALEQELLSRRIYCAYSLARSLSFGMNAVFHQLGYSYTGRLTKNCNIFDKFEDMSLWVKNLSDVN